MCYFEYFLVEDLVFSESNFLFKWTTNAFSGIPEEATFATKYWVLRRL